MKYLFTLLLSLFSLELSHARGGALVSCTQPGGKGSPAAFAVVTQQKIHGTCYFVWTLKGATAEVLAEAGVIHGSKNYIAQIVGETCQSGTPFVTVLKNGKNTYRLALENLEGDGYTLRAVDWNTSRRGNQIATVYFGQCTPADALPSWRTNL